MLSIFLCHQFLSKNTVKWEMSSRSLGAEIVASTTTMIMVILIGEVMFPKGNNSLKFTQIIIVRHFLCFVLVK